MKQHCLIDMNDDPPTIVYMPNPPIGRTVEADVDVTQPCIADRIKQLENVELLLHLPGVGNRYGERFYALEFNDGDTLPNEMRIE